ncbi:hypothetical protein BKA69DRAFT_1026013, partial [Paraphysoderma sedebokerense]
AEDFAGRLAKEATRYGLQAMTADFEDYEPAELKNLPANKLAIFVMATYGEGEPTDNAVAFHEWLSETAQENQGASPDELPLKNLHYVAFGLGNKTYEHFNLTIRNVDKWCKALGGTRIGERGEGDDDANLEEDYLNWKDNMWLEVCKFFKIDPSTVSTNANTSLRSFSLVEHQPGSISDADIYTGQLGPKTKSTAAPTYDAKNPYYATLTVSRELFSSEATKPSEPKELPRNCLHMEIDVSGSRVTYQSGDHVAIWPTNDSDEVSKLAKALGLLSKNETGSIKFDQHFSMVATDPSARKKHPFPCPTSYRTAFTHYVDLSVPPKQHVLQSFISYAADEQTKNYVQKLSTDKEFYNAEITEKHSTIADLLAAQPQLKVPIDLILESLPRIQARYYSISSSSKAHPTSIHITATILRYKTSHGKLVKGLCTNYLYQIHQQLLKDPTMKIKVPIYVRHSNFKLPRRNETPVIMIGPGTGVAPFRGFIQERSFIAAKQASSASPVTPTVATPLGEAILFFGCRKATHDFLYREEWTHHLSTGGLTKLITAFSRDQKEKIYVQNKLEDEKHYIWDLVSKKGAYIYVCGDAKNMARDVNKWFVDKAVELGDLAEDKAVKWVKELRTKGRFSEDVWS